MDLLGPNNQYLPKIITVFAEVCLLITLLIDNIFDFCIVELIKSINVCVNHGWPGAYRERCGDTRDGRSYG